MLLDRDDLDQPVRRSPPDLRYGTVGTDRDRVVSTVRSRFIYNFQLLRNVGLEEQHRYRYPSLMLKMS